MQVINDNPEFSKKIKSLIISEKVRDNSYTQYEDAIAKFELQEAKFVQFPTFEEKSMLQDCGSRVLALSKHICLLDQHISVVEENLRDEFNVYRNIESLPALTSDDDSVEDCFNDLILLVSEANPSLIDPTLAVTEEMIDLL